MTLHLEGAHLDSVFVPTYQVDVKMFLRMSENFNLLAMLEDISGEVTWLSVINSMALFAAVVVKTFQ